MGLFGGILPGRFPRAPYELIRLGDEIEKLLGQKKLKKMKMWWVEWGDLMLGGRRSAVGDGRWGIGCGGE